VVACVVPKAGTRHDAQDAEQLIAHCRGQLIKWSCPREIRFLGDLPKTRVGKIDFRALQRQVAAERRHDA